MQTLYRSDIPQDAPLAVDACQGTGLQKIILKAKYLLALDGYLKTHLPAEFVDTCHVMNVHINTVILGVNSAAVATRLRYLSDDLVRALQQKETYKHMRAIQFKIGATTIRYHATTT